jgi:hypothetical protein
MEGEIRFSFLIHDGETNQFAGSGSCLVDPNFSIGYPETS